VAPSNSNIVTPAIYWRAYVGGSLGASNLLVADVNLDGAEELVYVSGGSVVARSGTGKLIWQTSPRDIQSLVAIDDFDGDGLPDVLVGGTSQAFLLAGKDGSFEWSESPSDFGTLGSLRVADLNGDGHPDIVAEECHCCAVTNGASGFAYSFSRPAAGIVATLMWGLPPETGDFASCGVPTVLFDPTGNGTQYLAHEGDQHVWVIGNAGTVLVNDTNSPALGKALYNGDCIPANVDGVPGDELICFQPVVEASDPTPRQVLVLQYTSTPTALNLLWQNTTIADASPSGALIYAPNAVVDLDGNGTLEVVVSGMSGGAWTTYVFDAKKGTELATIPGAYVVGTAPLRADKKVNILTSAGNDLTAWTYDSTQTPPIQSSWTESNRQPISRVDPALLRTQRANTVLATPDLNNDGIPDALTLTHPSDSSLYDYAAPLGVPKQVATYAFPAGVAAISTWVVQATTEKYPQVATVSNDGLLDLFNNALAPDLAIKIGGFCAGGLRNSPLLSTLGSGGGQPVFINDSRGDLIRFNAQGATFAGPPLQAWSVSDCANPSVIPALDGANSGIVCHSNQPPTVETPSLSALRGDGSRLWNVPLPARAVDDALPASAPDGGAPTIFVQTVDSESNASTLSLAGATGQQQWATTPVALVAGILPFAVSDWNADGVSDVLTILNSAQAISGATGQSIVAGQDFLAYGVPILQDVNNDGTLEFTMQGGQYPSRTLLHDLQTPMWVGPYDEPIPTGAIATCPNGPQLLEGNQLNPSRLYMTQVAGASAGTATFTVLAGGKQYSTESAATADGSYLGQLSDLAIGTNLMGTGNATAVVGSTDGWLYAVDACNGTLQFVVPFGESVCGAVLGDTNGDGRDEVLVSTSGGYLYDVQNEALPSPAPVIDTDPPIGITNKEVSTIATQNTLYGAWRSVPGATNYQIAISHEPEGIISNPPWQDAGSATAGTITGLPLVGGQRYYFAARAIGPQGNSVDALSPGVVVIGGSSDAGLDAGTGEAGGMGDSSAPSVDSGPDATNVTPSDSGEADGSAQTPSVSGGGCSCRLARAPRGRPSAVLGAVLLIVYRRRRQRAMRAHSHQ
jgi:hypothetical protein